MLQSTGSQSDMTEQLNKTTEHDEDNSSLQTLCLLNAKRKYTKVFMKSLPLLPFKWVIP